MSKKALILRTCRADMTSSGGFKWPESGPVECPDWNPAAECGNGLHGLLWGKGDYCLLSKEHDAKWLVAEVDESTIVDLGGKVKFPRANVVFCGTSMGALAVLRSAILAGVEKAKDTQSTTGECAHSATTGTRAHSATTGNRAHSSTTGYAAHSATTGYAAHSATTGNFAHSSTTGDYAHSSTTGDYAHSSTTGDAACSSTTGDAACSSTTGYFAHSSTTGDRAHSSTTGDRAHSATTGNRAHSAATGNYAHSATTGNYAHSATTGNYAHSATTGEKSIAASLGCHGRAKAGPDGCVIVGYWDEENDRPRVVVGYVGEKGIKADTWYYAVDGQLKEVADD